MTKPKDTSNVKGEENMDEKEKQLQGDIIKEILTKSTHSVDFLVSDLRDLAHHSNLLNDRALNLLTRQLIDQACKLSATLAELQP